MVPGENNDDANDVALAMRRRAKLRREQVRRHKIKQTLAEEKRISRAVAKRKRRVDKGRPSHEERLAKWKARRGGDQ